MPDMTDNLLARLRERVVIQRGEPITLTMPDGSTYSGTTGDIVQWRNPDGPEAATRIETMAARIERHREWLRQALAAIETGRSEPLFIMRDAIRNHLEDEAALAQPAGEEDGDGG